MSRIQWVKHITTCIKEIDRMQIFKPFTPSITHKDDHFVKTALKLNVK
jgi:hypothetical protein